MREFLEKHYTEEAVSNEEGAIKLVVKALLEVVQSGAKNVEVAIMKPNEPMRVCGDMFSHVCSLVAKVWE